MISDPRLWKTKRDRRRNAKHVFVDGVEIRHVTYVDTDAGTVKSYDALGDGVMRAAYKVPIEERQKIPGWNESDDRVLYKIVRGKVTLTPRHFRWRWHGKTKRRCA